MQPKKLYTCFLLPVALAFSSRCLAQRDTSGRFSSQVQLDSFVVKAGFDINAFIRRVRSDTTFYKAFKSLHFVPYTAVNDIKVYGRKNEVIASMHSNTRQDIKDHCRTTTIIDQQTTGDFLDRAGEYNYYTAGLFAHLFFAKEPRCNETDIVAGSLDIRGEGRFGKSEAQLKQLIFDPGARVSGIPFMGDRASVFDEDEAWKYDFKIKREVYEGEECYVFSITPKPAYARKALYNELITWFRKSDYSIVARDYSLSYSTLVYDFDVRMKVRTTQIGNKLYPTRIDYNGNWHVFTKKRERVKFSVEIKY